MANEANHERDVVLLVTAPSAAEAHIWQQALLDEDIPCDVVGDYLDMGFVGHPRQTAELWVDRENVDRAWAVLEAGQHAARETPTDETEA
jgi:hypothetical protein